jgi:hypothetical protein
MMKELDAKLAVNLFFVVMLSAVPAMTAHSFTISGNYVGIGTDTPAQPLDVVGNVNASGSITANSFTGSGAGLTGISGANITVDSVGSGALATGAVIAGKVAADAISPVTIDFLGKVAIVALSGGDYNSPATAMSDFQKWCGTTPSAENPCLLKIMPGVYIVGTSSVQMQQYIDIEGSGENTTIIQGSVDSSFTGIVNGANHAEIRFLTVKNTGGGEYATAIYNASAAPKITNVTATASGSNESIGISNFNNSSPTMTNVTATASGSPYNCGVRNLISSSPIMTNVTAIASGSASNHGVANYNTSSPTMTNVTATATGGDSYNRGVYNENSSPIMTNVTAIASGSSIANRGVENDNSSPIMTNVSATASGGSDNRGVDNNTSSPIMTNVAATASGGSNSYGVYNFNYASATVKINHSVIKGTTNSIFNNSAATIFVANTQLDGGVVFNEGTITCVGTYNASYVALDTICQ